MRLAMVVGEHPVSPGTSKAQLARGALPTPSTCRQTYRSRTCCRRCDVSRRHLTRRIQIEARSSSSLLADEINHRASPAHSPHCSGMPRKAEVTTSLTSPPVPRPFMVIAAEPDRTAPAPEAAGREMDRFLSKPPSGYPNHDVSVSIRKNGSASPPCAPPCIQLLTSEDVLRML